VLPRAVPAAARARSLTARARMILGAAQRLAALTLLHRAQPEPPADPSLLRWFLVNEFLAFRRLAYLRGRVKRATSSRSRVGDLRAPSSSALHRQHTRCSCPEPEARGRNTGRAAALRSGQE